MAHIRAAFAAFWKQSWSTNYMASLQEYLYTLQAKLQEKAFLPLSSLDPLVCLFEHLHSPELETDKEELLDEEFCGAVSLAGKSGGMSAPAPAACAAAASALCSLVNCEGGGGTATTAGAAGSEFWNARLFKDGTAPL